MIGMCYSFDLYGQMDESVITNILDTGMCVCVCGMGVWGVGVCGGCVGVYEGFF